MNKLIQIVIVLCLIAAAAFLLNPSAEQHRAQIKASVAERSPLAGLLGIGALTAFVSNYHSVGVASYTRVQGRTVSVGCFGMVFVLDEQREA